MSNRVFVLSLLWLSATAYQSAVGQPPRDIDDVTRSGSPDLADKTAAQAEVSAEDAIRIAVGAIDQLESADEETRRALLHKISGSIEAIARSSPGNPWLYYLQGSIYAVTDRGVEAASLLQRFVETRAGRNEWKAHRVLGDLFVGRYPRLARASYEAAAKLKRDEPTVLIGLSKCAFSVGDIDGAVQFARRAVGTGRRHNISHGRQYASMLMAQESWAEAQRVAEGGLVAVQTYAEERGKTRAALEAIGDQYGLLIDILSGRVQATPDAADAYVALSEYLRLQGENDAVLSLHNVLGVLQVGVDNTAPDTPVELLQPYAITLAELGRLEEAVAQFETILARDVGNPIATEWLARLRPNDAAQNPEPQPQP
ncbi:MAG: tetratricopeptide repeat protein [Planctomycetota bacterium]|jgi:tetratricopeptide (TPR) repeat protein